MKLHFGHNKLCKKYCVISVIVQKKSRDQYDDITDKLYLSKISSNMCSNFTLCWEICKEYVVTRSRDWSMTDV